MTSVKNYLDDFIHLFFPHVCIGCNSDVLQQGDILCARCLHNLPETGFLSSAGNPVEKIFYGRLPLQHAGSAFYFNKGSLIQHMIVRLKYKSQREAGIFLGRLLGQQLAASKRYDDVDIIIPLPLNDKKLFKRGYNQAGVIVKGITSVWHRPVAENAVERMVFTETQTRKGRIARWETMQGAFAVTQPELLKNRHVLLVDDIITTGATLEACGEALLKVPGTKLSVATLAYTI